MRTNAFGSTTGSSRSSNGRIPGDETVVQNTSSDAFFFLIRSSPFGIFLIDANFSLIEFSEGCRKVFDGIDPLIGRDFAEILWIIWPEPFASEAIERFSHTLKTGEPYRSPDTTEKRANIAAVESYDWHIDRISLPDGQFGVICHFYEATDRYRAERDGTFLLELTEQLRAASDIRDLLCAAVRITGDYLELDRCFVSEISSADDRWTVLDEYRREDQIMLAGDHRLSEYDARMRAALASGTVEVINDTSLDPRSAAHFEDGYKPLDVRAAVIVPLLREGEWVASFTATCKTPRTWSQREVSLLETVAERTWATIEKLRAEENLRESRMQLDNALKAGRMGAWHLDLANGVLQASDNCKSNFGRNIADIFTYGDLRASIHPDDLAVWQEVVETAIKNCGSFELEYRAICPDRSVRWIAVLGNCYAGPDGETATLAGITVDITDRKLAERKLVEGSEFNQEIIDSLSAHISVLDQDGKILAVNESWRRFAQENGADWTMKGVGVETNYLDVCSKATCEGDYDALTIRSGIEDVLKNRSDLFTIEYPCHSPTQRRWFLLAASPLRHMGGAVVSHTNITERRLAEEALRKSQERFDIVREGAEIGFWFCDLPFDELVWDARVKEHFWLSPDARVTIETFYEQMHPDDRERTRRTIEDSILNKSRYNIDYRTVSPQGEIKWIRAIGRTFYDGDGHPVRFDGVTLDITDRRNAEKVLRERELLESTLKFREAERLRIARDLHDQLGQQLTALRLTIADLLNNPGSTSEMNEKLLRAQDTALALDKDVSSLAFELRSNILTEQGLADALSKFVLDWSKSYEIDGDFQMVGSASEADLSPEMETNLYRIVQEALNNATKHAKADHVGVILDVSPVSVRLIIEDDGVGFDPDSIRFDGNRKDRHGLGLKGMRERVDLMKGVLEIDSAAGRGTTIFVTVPLAPASHDLEV